MAGSEDERSPLLQNGNSGSQDEVELLEFGEKDPGNPKTWPRWRKMANVAVIALMAILSPLASSMFTPGIKEIAKSLNTDYTSVIGATTGFVCMLGLGPLVLAPLSETFGRRIIYLTCFSVFTLLQIPTALSPNVETLVAMRTIAGFFGSVGIANGGGTISDMFEPSERAGVFGWYLLGPLLGPTLGPLFGGLIVQYLNWRWIFWAMTVVCAVNTTLGFLFLKESFAPVILAQRCKDANEQQSRDGKRFSFEGADDRPFTTKIKSNMIRPIRILFTQPIVFIIATYQAIIFGTMYSLYTNFEDIYSSPPYNFSTVKVGLLFLGPGLGFLIAVWFLVPQIDKVYNRLTKKNDGKAKPEFRLPLANVGAVLLPVSVFWFAWTIEYGVHWTASIAATLFFGIGQVAIFNSTQNYYIDAFAKYAASAIAAGATFRSLAGGVVPLFVPSLLDKVDYGWGLSVFGFACLALSPSPLLFYYFGERVREKFAIEL